MIKITSSQTSELITISSLLKTTSKKLEANLLKENQFQPVTVLISQDASKPRLLLIRNSKQTWINMIRITLFQTSVLTMTLSPLKITSRRLVVNSPKRDLSQHATV
jgi:hypothetical protein